MKPLAAHGTTARARGRRVGAVPPCHCRPCRDALNRYAKQLRVDTELGRPRRVDAAPVAQRLRLLLDAGCSWRWLAEATGCHDSALMRIFNGQRRTVAASTAAAVMAVRPGGPALGDRPAVGSMRRVRALLAAGHRVRDVVEASGLDPTTVWMLLADRRATVRATTETAIIAAYARLSGTVGTFAGSLVRADRGGWAPPQAWDAHTIDDPDATPGDWQPERADGRGLRVAVVVEDVEFLRRAGLGDRHLIAERLGMTPKTLERALIRAKRAGLEVAA